jgi:hypothetical protein
VRKQGGKLVVFPMNEGAQVYSPFLTEKGVQLAECYKEVFSQAEYKLFDGHPNTKQLAAWLPCISEALSTAKLSMGYHPES